MNVRLPAVAVVALCALPVAAQESNPRNGIDYRFEVLGDLGWGRRGGDEGSHGGGVLFGGGLGFRPFRRIGFEVEASYLSNERSFDSGVTFEGDGFAVSGNVLFHFSESRMQWYVLGGLGWLSEEQTSTLRSLFSSDETILHHTDEYAVWSAGVGFKRFVSPRILLRPELRYSSGGPLGVLGIVRVTVGVGYVW